MNIPAPFEPTDSFCGLIICDKRAGGYWGEYRGTREDATSVFHLERGAIYVGYRATGNVYIVVPGVTPDVDIYVPFMTFTDPLRQLTPLELLAMAAPEKIGTPAA